MHTIPLLEDRDHFVSQALKDKTSAALYRHPDLLPGSIDLNSESKITCKGLLTGFLSRGECWAVLSVQKFVCFIDC